LTNGCNLEVRLGKQEIMGKLVIELQGGLGNQLFQFANAFRMNRASGFQHEIVASDHLIKQQSKNSRFTSRCFELQQLNYSFGSLSHYEKGLISVVGSPKVRKFINSRELQSLGFLPRLISEDQITSDLLESKNNKLTLITGFWQNAKDYISIRDEISTIVESIDSIFLSPRYYELLRKIENTSCLCIHFRRSDYISNIRARNFHGLLGKEYFSSAYSAAIQAREFSNVFVFTEDREIISDAFDFINGVKVEVIDKEDKLSSWENLLLMSKSTSLILSNSTFSWWSAFINRRLEMANIFGPSQWFRQGNDSLMLPSWTGITPFFEEIN